MKDGKPQYKPLMDIYEREQAAFDALKNARTELRCTVKEFRNLKKVLNAAKKVVKKSYAKNYDAVKVDDAIRDMKAVIEKAGFANE